MWFHWGGAKTTLKNAVILDHCGSITNQAWTAFIPQVCSSLYTNVWGDTSGGCGTSSSLSSPVGSEDPCISIKQSMNQWNVGQVHGVLQKMVEESSGGVQDARTGGFAGAGSEGALAVVEEISEDTTPKHFENGVETEARIISGG